MSFIKKLLTVFLLTFFTVSIVEAQVNPVYKIMRQRGWTPLTKNNKTKLTGAQMRKNILISMGYNDSIISNLKKIGVDLLNPEIIYDYRNIKASIASSDCIIIGTVVRKEYPLKERATFHTIAYVQVEEFLRNDYNIPKDQIPVMIESGPTASGGKMIAGDEDTLRIGEHALFFLTADQLIIYANYNEMFDLFDRLINDPTIRFRIFTKYDLKDDQLITKYKFIDLSVVEDDVNTVMKAIQLNK